MGRDAMSVPTPEQVEAGNLYHSRVRGWRDGACARRRDPRFAEHDREDLRAAYARGYQDGAIARHKALRGYAIATGYQPNILRGGS